MKQLIRCSAIAVVLLTFPFLLCAQGRLQFEVVAVKPAGELSPNMVLGLNADGSQVHITWSSLTDLVNMAYRIKRYQISGPSWLPSDHFDVVAKIPDGFNQRNVPEMLQAMLQDRFDMKSHWEKKELPVYTLGLSKPVSNLKDVAVPETETSFPIGNISSGGAIIDWGSGQTFSFANSQLDAKKLSMDHFTEWFSNFMDRPVINNTGLKGYYDFTLKLSPRDFQTMWIWAAMAGGTVVPPQAVPTVDGLSLETLPNSLKELGLKLERGKGPIDVLVIDSIQKKPTEN
jgi:uncharacterized protein (TIGR03435 family)